MSPRSLRSPSFAQSLLCFSVIIALIAGGLFGLGISLHALIFLCLLWAGGNAFSLGYTYLQIRELMTSALTRAMPAIYIFILIGMVIASFMQSGTISTLIYYGLSWLNPCVFLAVGLILCAVMSVSTGTSWGTVGTMGVVLMGIGVAMNIPPPIVAAMVVCGATFGDKMSPVSDTTNLAAMSAGTNLYRHMYAMLLTTLPSFLLTLIIFLVIGFSYTSQSVNIEQVFEIKAALASQYNLAPYITLLPLMLLTVLSIKKVSAEVTMSSSILLAVTIAIFYQGTNTISVLNALWENTPQNTGIANLDALLGRGGISSMSWTLLLALMAIALGGILHGAGVFSGAVGGHYQTREAHSKLSGGNHSLWFFGQCSYGRSLYLNHIKLSVVQSKI